MNKNKNQTAFLNNVTFPAGLEIEHKATWVQYRSVQYG